MFLILVHHTLSMDFIFIDPNLPILQVGLADIIDMYYEDIYTLPNKELSCEVAGNFTNLPSKKVLSLVLPPCVVPTSSSFIFKFGYYTLHIKCIGNRLKRFLFISEEFFLVENAVYHLCKWNFCHSNQCIWSTLFATS